MWRPRKSRMLPDSMKCTKGTTQSWGFVPVEARLFLKSYQLLSEISTDCEADEETTQNFLELEWNDAGVQNWWNTE
jgi:hypothetical protein